VTWEKVKLGRMTIGLLDAERKVYRVEREYPGDVARRYDAYGIDADTVQRMHQLGVTTVEILEKRGRGRRIYVTPIQEWVDAPVDHLGEKGLPHAFVRLADLPKPVVLRGTPCDKRLGCCGRGRCAEPIGHWKPLPPIHDDGESARRPTPHRCEACARMEPA
jgi:hypothetical protein